MEINSDDYERVFAPKENYGKDCRLCDGCAGDMDEDICYALPSCSDSFGIAHFIFIKKEPKE